MNSKCEFGLGLEFKIVGMPLGSFDTWVAT